jgi:hypothetical protein
MALIKYGNSRLQFNVWKNCGGVLINRRTILSSTSCLRNPVTLRYINQTYEIYPEINDRFPNYNSMYFVYIGAHSYPGYGQLPSEDTDHLVIDDIIQVIFF